VELQEHVLVDVVTAQLTGDALAQPPLAAIGQGAIERDVDVGGHVSLPRGQRERLAGGVHAQGAAMRLDGLRHHPLARRIDGQAAHVDAPDPDARSKPILAPMVVHNRGDHDRAEQCEQHKERDDRASSTHSPTPSDRDVHSISLAQPPAERCH
jgi:hypothetical protein